MRPVTMSSKADQRFKCARRVFEARSEAIRRNTAQETPILGAAQEYWIDAWQRGVLLLRTLNERGNAYLAPQFAAEVVLDGRMCKVSVNYWLVCIVPPADVAFYVVGGA